MSDQSNTLSKLLELQKSKSNGQINDNLEKRRQEALLKKEQFIKAHSPISTKWPRSHSTPDIKLKQSKLSFTPEESENEETKITINIELFSKNEFLLKTNVFPGALIREAFIMSGGVYNYQEYAWILPISQYQHFKHTLKDFKNVSYVEIPEFVTKGLLAPKITYSKYAPIRYENERIRSLEEDLPSEINERLYQFQREGVRFALEHHGRVLIGDEMGVGKTIQGVSIAACYRDEWPVLIICPASMKLNWRDEFVSWIPSLKASDVYVIKNTKAIDSKASIWIISYTMATNIEQLLKTKSFNMVIVDESHYLKNTLAKRTQKLVPILQRSKRIILLSGTPVLSRPAELFPQVSCIRPDIFNSFRAYAERFCDPKVLFNRTDYSGAAHMRELNIMISSTLMIRRLKSEVLAELPSKIRQKIEIPVSQENCKDIRKSYFDMKKKAKDMANDINSSREGDLFLSNAYKLTALAKLKGVSEYVSYLIQNDCKFIIFGHHMDMLDAIEETVTKEKVKYIRIDGSTNEKKRHQGIEIFQTDKECKVAILGILAAGQGITLTAASTVVMAEMAWTPGVMIQAEDRAHRIGQAKSVNIHYLFGPGTLDEFIWPKVHAKLTVITGALDGTDNIDIRSLLQPECKIGMGDFENEFEIFHRKRKESSDSEEKMAKLNDN